ncbi:MAG: anthranilate synthase component I [Proteobacteria bacterium]|jgi:anthranilate synthase component I|nr:anthranilate synthase component I [Pseudomonadota bacterium]
MNIEKDDLLALVQQGYTHIPLVMETLADLDTPVSTYLKLADAPYTYLFESVVGGDEWGRYSIIGLPAKEVFRVFGNAISREIDGVQVESFEAVDPLEEVRKLQNSYRVAPVDGLPEMFGGLVGFFGYESIAYIEGRLANQNKPDAIGAPDIMLLVSKDVVVFDNLTGKVFMVTLVDLRDSDDFEAAHARLDTVRLGLQQSLGVAIGEQRESTTEPPYKVHFLQDEFEQAVEQCREYIRDGEIMQVVLSQRIEMEYTSASIDLYRALRTINPSPYMYFMNMGEFQIIGSSPEILVRQENNKVTVRPIAGTRRRGKTVEEDIALEQELLADPKERAEHLMLIDLGRNDVGRIAEIGSVNLTDEFIIERYSHVMHIVSNVEGYLREGMDSIDVFKATFPAGTVSGAPKIRAMEIINELEPVKRGIYSGAVGYIGWNGNMDTAIAIRTAVVKDGRLFLQAGGGIVADSVPLYEWKETLKKRKAIMAAVEMAGNGLGRLKRSSSDRMNQENGGTE